MPAPVEKFVKLAASESEKLPAKKNSRKRHVPVIEKERKHPSLLHAFLLKDPDSPASDGDRVGERRCVNTSKSRDTEKERASSKKKGGKNPKQTKQNNALCSRESRSGFPRD